MRDDVFFVAAPRWGGLYHTRVMIAILRCLSCMCLSRGVDMRKKENLGLFPSLLIWVSLLCSM